MDGGASFYIAMAAIAAGTAIEADNAKTQSEERARILEAELQAEELRAIEQENERLIDLQLANDDISVRAGGIGVWSSPSLVAARKFNFRMFEEDQASAQLNLATTRASSSAQIRIFNKNARVAIQAGILSIIGTVGMGLSKGSLLTKPTSPAAKGAAKGIFTTSRPGAAV